MKYLLFISLFLACSCSSDNSEINTPTTGNCIEMNQLTFCMEHYNNQVLAKQNYLHKRIQLTGNIDELFEKNDTLIIALNPLYTGSPSWSTFWFFYQVNDKERSKFLTYKKDDHISLCGSYSNLGFYPGVYYFYFENSEIIK